MKPAKTVAEARENLRILRAARDSKHCQQVLNTLHCEILQPVVIEATEMYDSFTRVTRSTAPLVWPVIKGEK